jgi:putative N6-adenine-specific DNA methylase
MTARGHAHSLVATCSRGLEEVLAGELVGLGYPDVTPGRGMVSWLGDDRAVVRSNLWLRSAARVLVSLTEGAAGGRGELYELASAVAWEELIAPRQTVVVDVAGKGSGFASGAFAALTVKDALVDRIRARRGERPDIDRRDADVRVHLHLGGEHAAIALDSTGEPLAHRGYRPRGGPAPLSETLAAGMLMIAGYDGSRPLLDPMCGTGTIAIEAALLATRTAPGLLRRFACERWNFVPARLLRDERAAARELRRPAPQPVVASDHDRRAVAATRHNAAAAAVAEAVRVERRDLSELAPHGPGSVIVTNPPYGVRLGDVVALRGLYRAIGDALKTRAAGCTAWLLVGDRELAGEVGLRPQRRVVLFNGPIECRLLRFDLYAGRKEEGSVAGSPGQASF